MSSLENNNDITFDITVPTDQEGIPLSWDGNYATILGLLHETNKYLIRKALLPGSPPACG